MDVKLNSAPNINCQNQSALYTYLRDVSNNSKFAISVRKVLIEERQSAHRICWNQDRAAKLFKVGDVVKAHVQVQSQSVTGDVKNVYQSRRMFQIREFLEGKSYLIHRYNNPLSAT